MTSKRKAVYAVEFDRVARKELEALPDEVLESVVAVIDALASDPFPAGCKKLKGFKQAYRVRVGDYRILYEVLGRVLIVRVFAVRHRSDAYHDL